MKLSATGRSATAVSGALYPGRLKLKAVPLDPCSPYHTSANVCESKGTDGKPMENNKNNNSVPV